MWHVNCHLNLAKTKNNTGISFYQIYLSNLIENILKYDRLNIFEEIAISFKHGGARGVMVIVDTVQILDLTDCISHSTNALGKGMNPIILPPAMGK